MNSTAKILIDNSVPIPLSRLAGRYPFGQLEVGQSFFTTDFDVRSVGPRTVKLRAQGRKFTARTVTEGGETGVRVWRTA